jgi:hypothetical protein
MVLNWIHHAFNCKRRSNRQAKTRLRRRTLDPALPPFDVDRKNGTAQAVIPFVESFKPRFSTAIGDASWCFFDDAPPCLSNPERHALA